MELDLADIAIKDALTYKTSFRSLLQSSSSKLEDIPKAEQNIHYYEPDLDCHSLINDSFRSDTKNVLSSEFASREDVIHFASTPCLLLKDSVDRVDLDQSLSSLQDRLSSIIPENPFKKKWVDGNELSSQPKG
jgi:hypothetical protein